MAIKVSGIYAEMGLNLAKLVSTSREAKGILQSLEGNVKGFVSGTKAALGTLAVGFVVKEISQLHGQLMELAEAGDKAGSIADAFKELGGSSSEIDKAKKATFGLVNSFDLMAVANKGLLAGTRDWNKNFGQIADLGARVAKVTGQDTKQSIENLSDAIVKGNAKALKPLGFQFTDVTDKAKVTAEALQQLPERISKISAESDSASKAYGGFKVAIEEAKQQIGIAINDNIALRDAWREVTEEMGKVDWKQTGKDLAEVAVTAAEAFKKALPIVLEFIGEFNRAIQYLFTSTDQAIQKQFQDTIEMHTAQIQMLKTQYSHRSEGGWVDQSIKEHEEKIREAQKSLQVINKELNNQAAASAAAEQANKKVVETIEETGEASEQNSKQVDKFNDKLSKLGRDTKIDSLKTQLDKAVENLDQASFEPLLEQFKKATYDGVMAGFDLASLSPDQLNQLKQAATAKANEAGDEISDKLAQKMTSAYEESVENWRSFFENAITGTTFSLKDALKQVAVGFAAQMAQSIFGGLGKIGSPQDLGGSIAQAIFGGGSGGANVGSLFSQALGGGGLGGAGALQGPLTQTGSMLEGLGLGHGAAMGISDALPGIGMAVAAASAVDALGKLGKSTKDTAESIGTLGGTAIGAVFGGPIGAGVGSVVGKAAGKFLGGVFGGGKDPEQQARKDIINKLEELIKGVGGIKFIDSEGNYREINDIKLGSSNRFNKPGWANETRDKYGAETFNAFAGFGEYFRQKQGIKENVGSQIGTVLLEQTGGLEGLQAIIQQLNITYEDFVSTMVAVGKEGDQSWLSIVSQIRDANDAFKDGLPGMGEYVRAFENFLKSNGKGQIALTGIKNEAAEAMQAGIMTIEEYAAALQQSGQFTQVQIDAMLHSFRENNITNLNQIAGATDLQLGQITASFDAYLQDHGGKWIEVADDVKEYNEALKQIPENSKKALSIEVKTTLDGNTKLAMESGIFSGTNFQAVTGAAPARLASGGILNGMQYVRPGILAGEAGPEAVLPLSNINGKLGVSVANSKGNLGGVTIVVNAPGAEAGMENRIYSVIRELEDRIMSNVIEVVHENISRGRI